MEYLNNLKETLCKEIENLSNKSGLSMGDIELVAKLTSTVKDIMKIERMKEGRNWEAKGSYSRDNDSGYSNMHYVRGHYSRDEDSDGRRADARNKLIQLMNNAGDDREREMLRRCVEMF